MEIITNSNWSAAPTNNDLSFVERSIKVLVVNDEWSLAKTHADNLGTYPLYDVACVSNAKSADVILSSAKRYHVCLLDLELKDIDSDEYYLVKNISLGYLSSS